MKETHGESPIKAHVEHKGGMVHSIETFGAVDGPGLRVVIFLEGCPLRCAYCCNKDMLDLEDYEYLSPMELFNKIKRYKPYFGKHGGVTISGGDPAYQPDFVKDFLKICKEHDIHTALDTSLFISRHHLEELIPYVDLFMVSLKHFNDMMHMKLTMVSNEQILSNIKFLSDIRRSKTSTHRPDLWFRFVVLPGYTTTADNLEALVEFLHTTDFDQIELLPYHTLGKYKWKELGLEYPLEHVKLPTPKAVSIIKELLESEGIKTLVYE